MNYEKEHNLDFFNNEKFIFKTYEGFDYGFENENCVKKFEKLKIYLWTQFVPTKFVEILKKQKWRFFICETFEDQPDSAGICCYKTKTIFVRTMPPMINSFLHELGHVLQAYAKSIDRAIVNFALAKEASNYCDVVMNFYLSYTINKDEPNLPNFILAQMTYFLDPNEFMAQAISLVLSNYEMLKEKCPLTYEVAFYIIHYFDGGKEKLDNLEEKYGLIDN